MDKLHIFTDGHEGAPKQHFITPQEIVEFDKTLDHTKEDLYLLGDNFDPKNTKKKEIAQLTLEYMRVKKYFGDRQISGNHEGTIRDVDQIYWRNIIFNGVIIHLTHGHRIFWDADKVIKWENKEFKGIGPWKYRGMTVVNYLDENFYRKTLKLTKKNKACFDKYIENYRGVIPDVIMFGHTHTDELFDEVYNNVRWIGLPRGLTTFTKEELNGHSNK